jgi:hypothetical protein
MSDDSLFHKYDLRRIIESQGEALRKEFDGMQDARLLNMDIAALQSYAAEKYTINLPVLGDPIIDEGRTKMEVGRYGGYSTGNEPTVLVDAQRYTLEVPFEGDKELFFARGSSFSSNPPRGQVREGMLTTTTVERSPNAEALNQHFDRFLSEIKRHLAWLNNDIDTWNSSIASEVAKLVEYRRQKSEHAGTVASGLKFGIKQRTDRAATYAAPVAQRRKITHQLPAAKPGAPPEPTLATEMYRAILDTLKLMSHVMERSPHAYATIDEETLRFQFEPPRLHRRLFCVSHSTVE